MLRPATPLAVILLIAFVLLLLSTLSTPIVKGIPLASYNGWDYGVFGGCHGDFCLGPAVGYNADDLFNDSNIDAKNSFSLGANTRHSLSSLLIVHPIAAFCALVCFFLAIAAHFHAPSHSPRYLLALLILTIPTLLVTLLAFLVDILFFVPHLSWGGWIVLGATILIVSSSIVTCAMRRTLVSRKARKKRIAENAEMSGATYYDTLAEQRMLADQLPRADSPPPMGAVDATDKAGPQFAAFEMQRPDAHSRDGRPSLDDRTPLNPHRDPSFRSASTGGGPRKPYGPGEDVPMMPINGRTSMDSGSGRMPARRPSRDQYGNPIPPGEQMAMMGDLPPPGLRHQGSQGSLGSNRSGGYPRGRGGFGPPPRGYGPPRGAYGPPRGGFGPPPRGAYGPPRGAFRGGPPPPGWNGRGRGGYGPPPPAMRGRGGAPRPGPPPGYMLDPYYTEPPRGGPPPSFSQPPPTNMHDDYAAAPGMAIGQAIEMDERTGNPSADQNAYVDPYGHTESQRNLAGPVDGERNGAGGLAIPGRHGSGARSPTSVYSDQAYAPQHAQWNQEQHPQMASQLAGEYSQLALDTTVAASPPPHALVAMPAHHSPVSPISPVHHSPPANRTRAPSEPYYEDVDPRFATEDPQPPSAYGGSGDGPLPPVLTPGGPRLPSPPASSQQHDFNFQDLAPQNAADGHLPSLPVEPSSHQPHAFLADDPHHSYLEPIPDGTRSPAEGSEASHFTSVSQRGINPNWRPPPGSTGGPPPSRRRNEDIILNGNPDFSLPMPSGPGRGRGGRGGMMRGGGGGGGHQRNGSSMSGLTPQGRYPTDI